MKAIFKHLFVMMTMLAMTIGFIGCNDDDDNNDNPYSIVGTWFYEEDYDDDYYYEEITFKSNGTYIVEWEEYYNGNYDNGSQRGTYEVDGNELIWDYDDPDIWIATIVSITSSKLVLEDDDGDRMIYYRN